MEAKIKNIITDSIRVKKSILDDKNLIKKIALASKLVLETFKKGGRVYLCGNGGSAADAQHLAAEFSGKFYLDRAPLPAEALHTNTSFLTAVANDYAYDKVYERAIQAFGRKGDVIIGISTSGKSKNVILAEKEARKRGMKVISLTGTTGGEMKKISHILLNVPSTDTPRIQEAHIMIGQIICDIVEESLFKK